MARGPGTAPLKQSQGEELGGLTQERWEIGLSMLKKKKKKKDTTRNKKLFGKLTSKGKHIVKVGNHPYTKLVGKLKDKSSKIIP